VPPEHFYFGGGPTETVLHPVVVAAMIIAIILMLVLPRKYLIVPFLFSAFLIPLPQQVVIGGVHFFVLRIIILAGCVRLLLTRLSTQSSVFGGGLNSVDKVFSLWAICRASAFLLLFSFQVGAVVNQFGFLWDVLGGYFLLRFLIHDEEDVNRAIKCFAVLVVVLAICMVNEHLTRQNVFGLLGGIRSVPEIREGLVRAQGPFLHSILAGSFGATLLPLLLLLWQSGKSKLLAIVGVISSTCIMMTSASSTPIMAYVAGIVAVCFWLLRKKMRLLRWGIVIALVALHLVMKAPVWFLIARVGVLGSSSGYHRAMLVDQFIRNFGDWWLVGTNTNSNWGFDMWDLSNQFVAEGETGGLATLICFIAMIYLGFKMIGTARKTVEGDRKKEWFLWLFGAALFSHIVAFFGISYFDQTRVGWLALLAMITAATAPFLAAKTAPEHQTDRGLANPRLAYPSPSLSGSTASDLVGWRGK